MNWLRVAKCDLKRVLKDKQMLLWWVVMPLVFAYMFGSVMAGSKGNRTWLHVVKLDDHELADLFIDTLRVPEFNITVGGQADEHKVQQWSRAIVLPATFSADILQGTSAQCLFLKGQGDTQRVMASEANLIRALVRFNGAAISMDLSDKEWNEETKKELQRELGDEQILSVETKSHFTLRPPPTGFGFTIPGYIIMFALINSIMYGGVSLAYERQYKQLIRLRVAPMHVYEIFLGKIAGRAMQPILQTILLLAAGYFLMGVSLGDHPLALIPVVICFAICCGAFGVLFGSICTTENQVFGFGIMLTMVLSALGGCWWPLEMVPEFLVTIAKLTPTYWGLHGLQDVMAFGRGFEGIVLECLILLAYSAVLIAISIPLFRRNEE